MAKLTVTFTTTKTIWYYALLLASRAGITMRFLGIKTILKMKYQNKTKKLVSVDFKTMEVVDV